MPTSAELIDAQYDFELPRGLLDFNQPPRVFYRLLEEVGEMWEEVDQGKWAEALREGADIVIFAHSILGYLARQAGIGYEDVDRIIEAKMAQNHEKYHLGHWDGRTTAEAMEYSKEVWNKEL